MNWIGSLNCYTPYIYMLLLFLYWIKLLLEIWGLRLRTESWVGLTRRLCPLSPSPAVKSIYGPDLRTQKAADKKKTTTREKRVSSESKAAPPSQFHLLAAPSSKTKQKRKVWKKFIQSTYWISWFRRWDWAQLITNHIDLRGCVCVCVCDWRTVRGLNIDSYTFTADWKAKNCPSSSFEQLCLFFTPAHILHSFLVSTHPWDTHAAEHKTSVSDTAPSLCPPTPVYTSSSPSPSEETMSDKSTCTHWEGSWWVLIKRLCYMSLALLILDAI